MSDHETNYYPVPYHSDQSSLLFMPPENDSFPLEETHTPSHQAMWNESLLDNLWDFPSPHMAGTTSALDENAFDPFPPKDLGAPPIMQHPIPSINIDTTLAPPYLSSRAQLSPANTTPVTPDLFSPSTPGYLSSPSLQNLTPPTPANQLISGHDTFFTSIPSAPVSPYVQTLPHWHAPKRESSSPRNMRMSDVEPLPVGEGGRGQMVPQKRYKPHTSSDRRRYVDEVHLESSIPFYMQKPDEDGIPLKDAMHGRFARLVARDEPMFQERGPSISVRINWPGYQPWSRQIPTRDFRNPPGPITRAKLAKNVAKSVARFIAEHKGRQMEEDGDPSWGVGPGKIDVPDLILIRLDHVSKGSWQAQLQLARPRS